MKKLATTLYVLLVSAPLYLYLIYKILVHIQATEMIWFLFYIYIPVTLIGHTLVALFTTD